jgi:hypothetical protein
MGINNRPFGVNLKNTKRIQCHVHEDMAAWIDRYCTSRSRVRSSLGTNALYAYFFSYSWGESWISIEETLDGPDFETRNDCIVAAYPTRSYLTWFDTLPDKVVDLVRDPSPDYWKYLRDTFGSRVYAVRNRSMHFKRALIIYYKICQVCPDAIELDLDAIRPKGYEWTPHNFDDLNYLLAYTDKIKSLVPIDLSQPPRINLYQG